MGQYDIVIEVSIRGKEISATMKYWTHTLSGLQAHDLASTLSGVISQILDRPHQTVGEIQMLSQIDKEKISQWNKVLPQASRLCVHELIDQQCVAQPDAAAVCAWDGHLTYRELQGLSTRLALHLVSRGVKPRAFVPLCLSKSCWTPVAMLAVVKSGGAFVLLDPSLPLERLQEICNQLGHSPVIIASAAHRELAASLVPGIVMAENGAIPTWPALQVGYHGLPSITSNDALYAVFTSGSTGQPKGVVVEHGSYSTNAMVHTRVFDLTPNSRTLQFSGYSFDVSIFEHLTVLIAGGCLCIPSESDRYNQLAQVAARMEVNSMFLTPSVARMLSPEQIPTLKTLALVGEPMHQADINTWPLPVRLVNGYGPAESTIFCSIQPKMEGTDPKNIGWPTACTFWVTNPDDPQQLVPVGGVGELLIEGPILARCYLNDPEKTAASFIKSPKWLQKFRGKSIATEESRLYRTGDLVKYTPLGSLRYLGRKDTQVKLHGQRFELADVEHHVRLHFKGAREVVADVVRLGAGDTPPILIALVVRSRSWGQEESQGPAGETLGSLDDTEFLDAVASTRSRLHNVLPSYMIPTIFFPLNHVPLAKTGKADRRLLRQLVTALSLDKLDALGRGQVAKREPASAMEWALQGLFAKVLALNPEQVSAEDHFFRLRGDSISAMNLVAEARRSNLYITVADVFNHPTLSNLAKVVREDPTSQKPSAFVPAFSLLPDDEGRRRTIWQQAVQGCSMPMDQVEDIYPCTALQEGLMALSTQKTGMYTGQLVLDLAISVDVNRLQAAWQAVVDANPILRTRLIQTESGGSFQVIARHHDIFWSQGHSVEEYLKTDLAEPMELGQPLARFALIRQPEIHPTTSSPPTMIVTMHHAIHDRWTIPLLLRQADAAYHGTQLQTKAFSPFIKHIATQDKASAQAFWKSEFAGLEAPPFPVPFAPIATNGAETRSSLERTIPVHLPVDSTITLSNVIRLAWAVVISAYTDSKDVVFGLTVTGRSASLPQVDEITGPTIATLPFRVRLGVDETIEMALAAVQQQMTRTIKFEQTGLQHIRKMGPEAAAACDFQTHLGIQPPLDTDAASALMRVRPSRTDYTAFASYHLLLVCGLTAKKDAIDIHTNFDPSVVAPGEVAVLVAQFTHVLQQLCTQSRQKISALELVSPEDMKQLRCWNNVIPAPCTSTVHDLVLQHVQEHPNEPAVQSTDARVTFQELDTLSNRLARRLVNIGVQPGSIVPLCFEKSIWPIIAMLAVLRAGGTCVNIDPVLPAGRVQDMLNETAPAIALASLSREKFLREHAPGLLTVLTVPSGIEHVLDEYWAAPIADPSDAAFIIFTSGSTGRPKGIVMEHGNLSTSIRDHSCAMHVDSKSRSLHFAGYAFDASIYEIFTTLANGGCVCVPSEHERINGLASFIRRHEVNWMLVTPSVINSLRPEELPSIKTVVLGGEAVTRDNVEIWASQKQLINAYGPAEATICAAGKIPTSGWRIGTIGPILGGIGWVTMPSNPDLLAPLGAIGELLIEGPVVTREYLNQPELTEAAFISPPSWLRRFRFPDEPGRLYRSGDLVQYTTHGWIRYAGRKDTQVKLRGQRIELGEVEHHIRSRWPGAHEVIAEVVRRGTNGHESALLLAFIWYDGIGGQDRDVDSIFAVPGKAFQSQASIVRSQLLNIMPPYMVPAMLVPLSELPLTTTGKIDRRRLREEAAQLSNSEYQSLECGAEGSRRAPSTDLEVQLRQIWSRILDIPAEDIGVDDSLFSIGGDSISAMQVVAQCRSSGLILTVAGILRCKTIAKLAGLVQIEDKSPAATGGIEETDVDFDLSPIQQMFFETAPSGHNHFNQSFLVRLARLIEPVDVSRAIEALVAQHQMLRARFFKTSHGRWTQAVVENEVNNFIFTYHKVSSRQKMDSITRASQKCLNITQGPLFAVDMIEVEGGALYLFLVAHHLVIDLVSWRILLGDLEELLVSGRTLGVPSTSFQRWCQLQAAYSADNLLPGIALPQHMPSELDLEEYWGVSNDYNTCGNIEQHRFTLDAQTTRILFGPANYAFDTQPVEIFQAALLHAFIQTFADRPAPTIFTEGHGREPWDPKIDLTRTVGWFTTIWPTQVELSSDHDIIEAVRKTKDSRRSVPSKGWAYFTSRYLNAGGRRAFGRHAPAEILFNYAGLYQQLERSDALLQLEAKDGIADMAEDMGRFTLIDVAVSVSADCLQYIFYVNRLMRHQDAIQRWIRTCESSLRQAAERLVSLKRSYTLSDFQGLSLTYNRLDTFLHHSLPRFGLSESDIEDIYPCSPAQRGILLSQAKNPYQYHDRVIWRASLADGASVDIQKLRHAWQKVVDRHSILRTVFMIISQEGYMDQLVLREVTADVQIDEDIISDHLTTLTQDQTRLRPSHKLTISRDSAGVTLVELQISHALIDGSSNPIICRDLALAYDGNLSSFQQPVYRDYITYLQGLQQESAAEYWLKYMDGVDPCYFPNLNDADAIEETGTHIKSTNVNLLVDSRLHEFCKTHGLTITNTIHTAWALILRCYTGMDSVSFGYITSGRDIPVHAIEGAVGPFFNILLRRVHMPVDASLLSILHEQQDEFINSLSHQHYPLADLYHAIGLAGSTLFNTLVSVQNRRTEISSLNLNLDHMGGEHPTECAITVNIAVRESSIDAIFSYDTAHVPGEQATLLAQTFRQVLNEMITMPQKQISQVNLLSAEGQRKIVSWNERPPLQVDFCAHALIGKNCNTQPDSPAVCSWDGDLTYGELDRLSTALSTHLVSRGVGAEIFVPLYFERSKWTPVAMLAVLKAGGAIVLLDPFLPASRLGDICADVEAKVIVASAANTQLGAELAADVITVSDDASVWRENDANGVFAVAPALPESPVYAIFTSGSTGRPKGVVVEHRSFCSQVNAQRKLLSLDKKSRVLQFSGYSFDLGVFDHLATLMVGGCVCIPSENDRKSNLVRAAKQLQPNWAFLTPSVARIMRPKDFPSLQTICMAGEAPLASDVALWSHILCLNGYGPAECSMLVTIQRPLLIHDPRRIGYAQEALTWIVDQHNHDILLPIGAIGELVAEGRLVSRGYIGDSEKSRRSFIDPPGWRFRAPINVKPGRMYKTGDLVQYLFDGSLRYFGRKDTQVKLRGQRIELGDVEASVRKFFPQSTSVVADLIQLVNGSSPILVAFLCCGPGAAESNGSSLLLPATDQFRQAIYEAEPCLLKALPSYLIPTAFLPVSHIPLSQTGKTDRKRLKAEATVLTREKIKSYNALQLEEQHEPRSEMEVILQQLVIEILRMSADEIRMDDDFFRIGGDSIVAMKLVSLAGQRGLDISMKDIFSYPKLSDLAKRISMSPHFVIDPPAPFSLIGDHDSREALIDLVVRTCAVNQNAVEDIYPCTALQEGLVALAAKREGAYLAESKFTLPDDVDLNRLEAAWMATWVANPILRTRIIQLDSRRCYQVVISGDSQWRVYDEIQAYDRDWRISFGLGKPMVQLVVARESRLVARYVLLLRIHHAVYDGWSLPMLLSQVQLAYEGQKLNTRPFSPFISYVQKYHAQARQFWQSELADVAATIFPALPVPDYQPDPHSSTVRIVHLRLKVNDNFTLAVRLRLAWALVVSQYTGSNEVIFGVTTTGRGAQVPGIEQITGPTQATIPQRILINPEQTVMDTLRQIQDRAINTIPYEQFGLQNISQCGESHAVACKFQTLLVIQPPGKQRTEMIFAEEKKLSDLYAFSTHALMLVCQLSADAIEIQAIFDSQVVSERRLDRILRQFEHNFNQIYTQDLERSIASLGNLHREDLAQLASWNSFEIDPLLRHNCVHDAIQEIGLASPDATAVCAWDGDLSYMDLSDLSSALARQLQRCGVGQETLVPLYFEKSRWTPVAMLGVMKAGGAFVLLDPAHQFQRLQQICQEVKAEVVLASRKYTVAAVDLVGGNKMVITVSDDDTERRRSQNDGSFQIASSVSPRNTLYVVFTSGSTGKPKGVIIEHRSFYLNAISHNQLFGLSRDSRVLQFSGYAFDLCVMEHLSTLVAGGCICIPSEYERNNRLTQVISELNANWMCLTPSVARMLVSPTEVPTIKTLVLGGELMSQDDITTWSHSVRLMNAYGPAECAVVTTIQPSMNLQSNPRNIGRPTSSAVWITSPEDPNQLLPICAVGELLIEGPIIGRGYLNDAEKTTASFVRAPQWLNQFRGKSASESRLYRTGDMGKYQSDGSIIYLGRRDGQVKLRGQRIELAEVEYHVRMNFKGSREVIADVIRTTASDARQVLVTLVARFPPTCRDFSHPTRGILGSPGDAEFQRLVASVRSRLTRTLPNYMVPALFMPLNEVPLTKTGKTDRQLLHKLVSALSTDDLNAYGRYQKVYKAPATGSERRLQILVARVLGLNLERVSADDHFFQIGGDSIVAMKLVGEARQEDIYFSVADVFSQPVLCELAKLLRNSDEQPASIAAFTLLPGDEKHRIEIQRAAAESCRLDEGEIDDIYPCTALQEGLMSLTAQNSGMYTGQLIYKLADTVDLCHFQAAWQSTLDVHPILRTRIIQTEADRSLQVVVKRQPITWRRNSSLEDYLTEDMSQQMTLGQPLARFALIQPEKCLDSSPSFMVLTLHHALYDGWSLQLILRYMDAAYHGTQVKTYHFAPFIKFATTEDTAAAHAFWLSEFAGLEAPLFPALPGPAVANSPVARCTIERSVPVHIQADASVTLSNMIRLALAIVVSAHTDCEDVVFGVTLSGRNAPVAHVEDIAGPTFTTVPFRIRVVADEPVEAALAAVQEHAVQMIPFEQTGLQNIRKISPEAAAACGFRTHLGVQLAAETADPNSIMQMQNLSGAGYDAFASYPLVFVCGLTSQNDTVHVNANFDPSIVGHDEIEGLVAQFSHVLQQLRMDPTQQVGGIELVSPEDLKQLHQWNRTIPAPRFSTLHDLVLQHARERPMSVAVSFASCKLTFGDLDLLSAHLAQHIAKRGVEKGSSVPLCFEKSAWPVVAMLAVLRAGGTCVNIDPALPAGRVRDILREVAPKVALSSPSRQQLLENCSPGPITVLTVPLHQVQVLEKTWIPPAIEPHDAAFIVFTSGSTGKPKGTILEHMNLSTSIHYHSSAMEVDQNSQSLHFASYAFDASIYEIFTTLVNGGCIHIPSESERVNDLAGFIHRHNINWATLTPSVVSLLRPEEVPNLHTLVLGGEAVTPEIADVWAGRLQLINGYGPAEATICAAGRIPRNGWRIGTIGPMLGSVGWVTMPSDPNRLAPLGAVGELLIEGPVVARKYLNQSGNQSKETLAGFIQPPPWLSRFRYPHSPGRIYQSGDLVQLTKDGQIRYVGRKDTQVKLHGQRIELGEVEHYVRSHFGGACEVIADVITRGAGQSALLLAFIWHNTPTEQMKDSKSIFALPDGDFKQQANKVRAQLQETLPPYMVPAVLLPLRKLPSTPTGKTDRRRLREEASRLSSSEYEMYGNGVEGPRQVPSTETEIQLQQLWVRVLKISSEDVEANSSFFHLGGNSIDAMLLVSVARQLGLELSVADVFKSPKLCDLAVAVKKNTPRASKSHQPCSLFDVTDHETFIREEIAAGQPFQPTDVIDVLPTTEFQRQFLRRNQRHYFMVIIPGSVHPNRMVAAIRALVEKHEILRTVFLPLKDTIAQVTLHRIQGGLNIVETTDVKTTAKFISEQDAQQDLPSGTPIFQATLIVGSDNHHALILRISHAQYDGVSFQHLYTDLTSAYQGNALAPAMQFSDYMKCRVEAKTSQAWNFWKGFLQGSCMTYLDPHSLGGQIQPASQVLIQLRKTIKFPTTPTDITIATVFKAAWALILARSTRQQDIVFGQVVNGRGVPLDGVEKVLGACVNIVPVRVIIQPQGSALALLRQVQDQHIRTLPFETVDLEEIVRKSTPWSHNTRFGSIAQHQNILLDPEISFDGMKCTTATHTMSPLPEELYAVSIPQGQNLIIEIIATNKMLSAENADRLLGELGQMVLDLTSYPSKYVSDLVQ